MVIYFRRLLDINDKAVRPEPTGRAASTYSKIDRKIDRKTMNYTYIVKCRDGTLYTGWTNNLQKRLDAHNNKKGARYTRTRTPVELLYYEGFPTKNEAMRREYEIKHLTAREKWALILA